MTVEKFMQMCNMAIFLCLLRLCSFKIRVFFLQPTLKRSVIIAVSLYKLLSRARGYKTFFMLNSAEYEICSAYKKLNTSNLNFLPAQQNWAWDFSCQ